MATVLDLTSAALREIGVLASGETAPSADSTDALTTLNRLLDSWANRRLRIFTITDTSWTIVSGTDNYTVGTAGTIAVARPTEGQVQGVTYVDTTASVVTEVPLGKMNHDAWRRIRQKLITSGEPTHAYYNPTVSTGTLHLYPVPTSSTLTGHFYTAERVAAFAALTSTVTLPAGYERMIVKNLAVELCPSYGREPSQFLVKQANEATAEVKVGNKAQANLSFDSASSFPGYRNIRGYNIRTDG